jgi:hypothetical protein
MLAVLGCLSSACDVVHVRGPRVKTMIVNGPILHSVLAKDRHLAGTFARRLTYVTSSASSPAHVPQLAGTVVPTRIYTSFATLAKDLAAGYVPQSVHAVMYDPEKWAATPVDEQRNPRTYMVRFSQLARAHHLMAILAPARDLVLVPGGSCVKRNGENLNQAYIRCRLATAVTQAGAFVIQSQANQFDVPVFHRFVAFAGKQARAANPEVAVFAQLATSPIGQQATVHQMAAAARSVAAIVDGFSLNIRRADIPTARGLLLSLREP